MKVWQSFVEALESLSANKLRSGLTILGIVIGVGAVIAMISIGRGAQNTITGSIQGIGTNLLFVMRGGSEDVRNPKPVTQFAGVTPEYGPMRNDTVTEGEFIQEQHLLGEASVAVIAPDTADKLFGRKEGIVGETVRIEGQPFRIIGVLKSKGGSGFSNEDDRILLPLTTAQTRLLHRSSPDRVDMILVEAVNAQAVPLASEEVAQILRQRHRTQVGADDFTVFTQQSFLDIARTITGVLTIFLGGIAAISLLVGGIGIMNIMLVSVTERTREIGLRKALGARKADILIQFLTESSVLSLIGGIIGIMLGWLISFAVGQIAAASNAQINPSIGIDTILIATLFSTAVGLFFGLYPANRAANLEPVEALRYE
jgi:putative ABC transport system permease protein